jgi:hypothetical protein
MRVLHFDMPSGIAGDMALAALAQLGAPLDSLRAAIDRMGLAGVDIALEPAWPSQIAAQRARVSGAEGDHPHRDLAAVRALIDRAGLPADAHHRALAMFERLAQAEAAVHGTTPERVTFHEVGAVDSIVDVVGVALALDHLAPDRISASPAAVGSGWVDSQHGRLPLPAPATLELLRGLPLRGQAVAAELTTPTGAAILATQVDRFGAWPAMRLRAIGNGAGSRRLADRPNLLRIALGDSDAVELEDEILIEANIDDMNPEIYTHLIDRLLAAGAGDAWLTPVQMKKGRPAMVVAALCSTGRLAAVEQTLFSESTTIGLRRQPIDRRKLERRQAAVATPWGRVRIKVAGEAGRILTAAPEYEDCRTLADEAGVALREVYDAARAAWRERNRDTPATGPAVRESTEESHG